jgi:hypothetical protein
MCGESGDMAQCLTEEIHHQQLHPQGRALLGLPPYLPLSPTGKASPAPEAGIRARLGPEG